MDPECSEDSGPHFNKGDTVQRVNQPEAIGVILDIHRDSQTGSWTYIIQFGTERRAVPEAAIRRFSPTLTPWDALEANSLSGQQHFLFTLTYYRLLYPPARIARSFATARTQFYPHQFRPVLKFLDNPGNRLLIADDVGLGKTIEAGYILRELDLRQGQLERVLVVVPARLTSKWKREMEGRFGDHFEIVTGNHILDQVNRLRQGRELASFRWIVSYESARRDDLITALKETPLAIDLLVADEAHRMRHSETLQHKVGAELVEGSDATLFLTATPVQTSLEDLWHLLRMLAPEEFQEWPVFEQQMFANRLLLATQRTLAGDSPNIEKARSYFEQFLTGALAQSARRGEFLQSVYGRVQSTNLDRHEIIELQEDIGRLSPTSHIISRTRKVEALPNRPLRKAGWVPIELTGQEREIYEAVEELCRMVWGQGESSWGYSMTLINAYRRTASCIPAAMDFFREKLEGISGFIDEPEAQELEEEVPEGSESVWKEKGARDRIQQILRLYESDSFDDSKLNVLSGTLFQLWGEDDRAARVRRKVVIFSAYPRTVQYLSKSLNEIDIKTRFIHGSVKMPDRETAIDDFLESEEVCVLVSSEVGGEGIDLQKACVVINYDLPWNPMTVEQRIGRVDRIGQESPTIYIFNFVVGDSIEERILQRLLTRIRIFEETIGELDDIIGNQVEDLTRRVLQGGLAGEELERVLRQTEEALEVRLRDAKNMLSKVDTLLAADEALIHEIQSVVGERQLPSDRELFLFLNRFLAENYEGCQMPKEAIRGTSSVDFHGTLAQELESAAAELGEDALLFARRISSGPVTVTCSREMAYRHPRTELIHTHHPLCRFAVAKARAKGLQHGDAFALSIRPGRLPLGQYVLLVALLHIHSFRPSTKMVAIVTNIDGSQLFIDPDETTPILIEILEKGQDIYSSLRMEGQFETIKERLRSGLDKLKADLETREAKVDQARQEQLHASQAAGYEFRLARAQQILERFQQSGQRESILRMAKGKVEKARRERDAFIEQTPVAMWRGIEPEEIAVGVLYVTETN